MKALIIKHKGYFIPFIFFFITGLFIVFSNEKTAIHFKMNAWHNAFGDAIMPSLTYLADGISLAIVAIVFLLWRVKAGLYIALSGAFSGFITQMLKRNVFQDHFRPSRVFEDFPDMPLYFVDGVHMHTMYSFPSGHTTAAFAMTFALAVIIQNKIADWILFFTGLMLAYTRIYLSQHFLEDIVAGSFVGLSTALILATTFYLKPLQAKWLNHSFISKKQDL